MRLKINELHQYGMTSRVGSLSGIALDFPRVQCSPPKISTSIGL
jgi:hypothetical protein